ncbi:MAG: hypothetical protein ACJAYC_003165 [Halieaceae bacterium]|jgi:hypothetical protein
MTDEESSDTIEHQTKRWLERFVIDLDLCPFAARELSAGRVRLVTSKAGDDATLLDELRHELLLLEEDSEIETTLLIHPRVLTNFVAYNDFLDVAEALLNELDLDDEFQIASFHPQYQFAGTALEDVENYTNRAPYPMLHLLREDSVAAAVAAHPDPESIPENNIQRMNTLGLAAVQTLLAKIQSEDLST